MHGLTADPPAPVSSYVGYSLDAPWGQPRVVLGLCAEEAEQLAVLLDRHDCVGPVHASVTAKPVGQAPDSPADTPDAGRSPASQIPGGQIPAGLLRVPQPAPASAGQQPLPASSGFSRQESRPAAAPRRRDTGPSPLTSASVPDYPDLQTPIGLAASRAVEASGASRNKSVNGSASPRADRAGGAATAEGAAESDDHPDPGSSSDAGRGHGPQPASGLAAGADQASSGQGNSNGHGNSNSRGNSNNNSSNSNGHGTADSEAATVVGGLPAVPVAIQPFMWAGGLARGTAPAAAEQPAARAGQTSAREDHSGASPHPAGAPSAGLEDSGGQRSEGQRSEGQRSGGQHADSRDASQNGSGIVAFRPRPAEPGADPGRAPGGAAHPGASAPDYGSAVAGRDAAGTDGIAGRPGAERQSSQGPWGPDTSGPWNGSPGHGGPGQGGPGHDAPGHGGSYPAAEHQQPASPAVREPGSREATGVRHPAGDPSRPSRVLRSGTLARLKRAGQACEVTQPGSASARPAAPAGDGRARVAPSASADAATWVSGELPGQAAVTDTAL